jgi:tubulin gamma
MRKAHCDKRPVFGWTVNEAALMRWAIRHKLDGVITDDPKLFLEVRKGWNEGMQESLGLDVWLKVVWVNCFAFVLSIIFRAKFGFEGGRSFVRSRV